MNEHRSTIPGEKDQPITMLELPDIPGLERRSRSVRSRSMLVGVAAAVVLLVAGFLVFSPDNTSTALAAVQSAAQQTARAESGRISASFDVEGTDGDQSATLSGGLDVEFSGPDLALTVDIDEASGESLIGPLGASEARLVDRVLYVNDGSQWYAVETGGFLGDTLAEIVDPRSILATVESLVETEEVATGVDVGGIETTHYRSVVDLGDDSLGQSGWLALDNLDLADIHAKGAVTIDLFIDGDGQLRQLDVSGDLREPGNGSGAATFSASTSFFDLGSDIGIEAPADAVEIDPLQGFDPGTGLGQGD